MRRIEILYIYIYIAMLWTKFKSRVNEEKLLKQRVLIVWEWVNSIILLIPKYLRDFGSKRGVSFSGVLNSTTYTKLV